MFASVATVGNAEPKVKVKVLEQASLEVMPLDHAEAVYGSDAHRELHPEENKHKYERSRRGSRRPVLLVCSVHSRRTHCAQFEECWCELVPHKTPRAGVHIHAVFLTLHRS